MSGPNPLLTKTFIAGAAVTKKRLLKQGGADDNLIEAVDGAAAIVGVSTTTVASGARMDVELAGLVEVEAGGTFARGDYVTADADGKAVVASPASGVNSNVAGIAMVSAVDGDIATVLLSPGRIQG